MLKYIEGFHENGMTISVFDEGDIEWAKAHGFFQADVEEAWDGTWWKTGTAPHISPKLYEEEQARSKRDALIAETDKYLLIDYPISNENLEKIKTYRQALRDITTQPGWPRNIEWPEKPKI